ncbi:MAG TPA: DeoR/GlpR family DNA-binding transcription regulator [Anaerolineae bacterium]|nr:DeoR/GlpR family DNA-binding transcription regulator [Anaerolineae bacterium]HQI86510.1 DeoR/GlpR family DNA-binding transcription regulator [Anaerolineae bacterium]
MFKDERQNLIVQKLQAHGSVDVSELARTFNVDTVTIRRDLAWLEKVGQLHRVHGGAVLRAGNAVDHQGATANLAQSVERRIAEAAARFIPDHSVIFLGPGTLTQEIVPFLNKHTHLTIITNALNIAWRIAQQGSHILHLIGGQAAPDYGLYGDDDAMRRVRADIVIFEAGGLDAERGLTHDQRDYATMARALFALSSQTVVLVAPERLGRVGAIFIAPAGEVDVLITGREAPTPPLWDLSELGVRIVLT